MITTHHIHHGDARDMSRIADSSVHLVVTSPPYPLIAMWDDTFGRLDPRVTRALQRDDGPGAFELMHRLLDPVWQEVYRILQPGGIACINIGDATRRLGDDFRLYANHARILSHLIATGFSALPAILWRKPTNAPTKFMGSGMLPAGAYVTLEHEYVLVVRKGSRRSFTGDEARQRRSRSAFFWEERNTWFSDVWTDLRGTGQAFTAKARNRSGAYPFTLPWRLVLMYSLQGDIVVDPFSGTGTTLCAAAAAGRNSIGFELESELAEPTLERIRASLGDARQETASRFEQHLAFVAKRQAEGGQLSHRSRHYGFDVMTRQEVEMLLHEPVRADHDGDGGIRVRYVPARPGTCDRGAHGEEEGTLPMQGRRERQTTWCE